MEEYDVESILDMYEDDYVPESRPMMAGGGRIPFANGSPKIMVDELEQIKLKTEPLNKGEKLKLYKSYDDLFRQEYKRLASIGDPFSKTDLNRAVINRIARENPTINLQEGIGLDKIPGGGNEESKTLFERYDKTSARGPLFTKKELKTFTQGNAVNARANTKTQENIFKLILNGNNNKTKLAKDLGISEGRLSYNIEKLMRNLAKGSGDQYTFLKDYKEKDLEKVRNNIYESPTLENAYQRTIIQSVLQSTELGSPERKKALSKLKEFNKFKEVMLENGIDPKLLTLDHAASYRAIKNGNIKSFLAVTPIIKDINTLKSSFDKRSQLNLRRMREYLLAGDNKNYKYFLKNQTELENLWKTMTGGQSSLGKIRVTATGPQKGKIKIFDYGATSLLDKNKNLLDELADNLSIRQNIVNASSVKNLDEARRIMLEGSQLTEKKMLGTLKKTDKAAKTQIDQSFKKINKPKMFKAEQQINDLLLEYAGTITDKCNVNAAQGGRIGFQSGKTYCLNVAKQGIEKGLKTGFPKNQQVLAEGILKAGRSLKDIASIRGLLGPAALAFTAVAEAGFIGYDMLSSGKSFKEAVGGNLFNYLLGDKTKVDLDEEIIKRLRSIPGPPSQGFREFTEENIGKMQAFKSGLMEISDLNEQFGKLDTIQKNREALEMSPEDSAFSKGAFQLDKQEDLVRENIQDFYRSGGQQRLENIDYGEGAKQLLRGNLLAEQDQLYDAGIGKFYQAPKGDEKRIKRLNEIRYQLNKLQNPPQYDEFGEYFMSRPPSEQSYLMSLGYSEGGIATLKNKKKTNTQKIASVYNNPGFKYWAVPPKKGPASKGLKVPPKQVKKV